MGGAHSDTSDDEGDGVRGLRIGSFVRTATPRRMNESRAALRPTRPVITSRVTGSAMPLTDNGLIPLLSLVVG